MYYEINVSLHGQHLFATHERSITDSWELENVYNLFMEKFPEAEGYKLDVTYWMKCGKHVSFKEENGRYVIED